MSRNVNIPDTPKAQPASQTSSSLDNHPVDSSEVPVQARHPAMRLAGVVKSYGTTRVLDRIHLDIEATKVTVILGPSGSGKSTLLRCINQLERLDAGTVHHDDALIGYRRKGNKLHALKEDRVAHQRRGIGMVFQQFHLFPHLDVLDNLIEAPMRVRKTSRAEATQYALALLEQVGLRDRAHAWPSELSGGQQQRVAIARALAMRPNVMLFDEPTSALDPERVAEVSTIIKSLARRGMTVVVVTHEIGFARGIADHVVYLEGGRIIEQGPPEIVIDAPRSERARAFLQRLPAAA